MEIGPEWFKDGKKRFGLIYDFSCGSESSQEMHFPSKEFSQPDFCLVFGCLHLYSLYLPCALLPFFPPQSQALTSESRR